MPPLYHYTNAEGARAAAASGRLRAQFPHNGLVRHRFPPAVYFTALGPLTDRRCLLHNNYDGFLTLVGLQDHQDLERKLDFYLEVDSGDLDPALLVDNSNEARSEWVHLGDVALPRGAAFKVTGGGGAAGEAGDPSGEGQCRLLQFKVTDTVVATAVAATQVEQQLLSER